MIFKRFSWFGDFNVAVGLALTKAKRMTCTVRAIQIKMSSVIIRDFAFKEKDPRYHGLPALENEVESEMLHTPLPPDEEAYESEEEEEPSDWDWTWGYKPTKEQSLFHLFRYSVG